MITREEYLNALELIDMYHIQKSDKDLEYIKFRKTKLIDLDLPWIMYVALQNLGLDLKTNTVGDLCKFNRSDFCQLRNTGRKSIKKFEDLYEKAKIPF